MIENNGKKLKSAIVVLALLLTALTVSMFSGVSATLNDPEPFTLGATTPTANTYYVAGELVYIDWTSSTNATGYNISINGTQIDSITNTYLNWDTTNYDIGPKKISVYAYNTTSGNKTYATGDNRTVYIVSGVPGVDIWQGGNYDITGTNNVTELYGPDQKAKVLNISTKLLKYGYSGPIVANFTGRGWTAATSYYLFYPVYTGSDVVPTFNLTWKLYAPEGVPTPKFTTGTSDNYFESIRLNRSGLWIIDDATTTDANMSTFYKFNSTVPAWFWVNSSAEITITASPDSFQYGTDTQITLTPSTSGTTVVDVRAFSDNKTIFGSNPYATGGTYKFWSNGSITNAGKYDVYAYKDNLTDDTVQYWDHTTPYYYDEHYGNGTIGIGLTEPVDYYIYALCGPYDPPEFTQVATDTITVTKGVPNINITNSTIYWGFGGMIDVNVTDGEGNGLTHGNTSILVKNVEGTYLTNGTDPNNLTILEVSKGNYTINFARGAANWKNLYTTSCNGTWTIYYSYDANLDGTYEWNGSKTFQVSGSPPAARIVIDSDGNGTVNDKKVDVPEYTGAGAGPANKQTILFTVFGSTITGAVTDYYGDQQTWEDYKNITISGDILYSGYIVPEFNAGNNQWMANVTPTKNGGNINIKVEWNTTDSVLEENIAIVNGTTVTTSADVIYVGEHTNLTVTVKDIDGDLVKKATVYLFHKGISNAAINNTIGDGKTMGKGANGEYTFWILPEDLTAGPDNITIAVKDGDDYGYANVRVEKKHSMMVNCTPTTTYAGDGTTYTVTVSLVGGGSPEEDATLFVGLYNETGAVVTGVDAWTPWSLLENEETKSLTAGTYHIYAYNLTSDSRGNNATIIVTAYGVESNPSELAWLIDTETNVSFMVSPSSNGTLYVENMTGTPNGSASGQETPVTITNGIGTLNNVNATTLGNVTFDYIPQGGARRPADGLMRITTASANSTPANIYLTEATLITIKLTHPATGEKIKSGVRVGLDHGKNLTTSILAKIPDDQFTDENGEVQFSVTAEANGNVTIYVMNGTDPENPFVIKAAARKAMTLRHDPSVDEGDKFTVEALYNGEPITDKKVTITFAGDDWTTLTGVVEITAPSDLDESYDWPLVANAEGYTIDVKTYIRVINKPNIYLTISETTWTSGSKYVVKPYADNGAYGIIVTLKDASGVTVDTMTAGPDGATFTAPKVTKDTTYTISATKGTGYVPAADVTITVKPGGIPGFELITLIAAIGIAFILIRRRRK